MPGPAQTLSIGTTLRSIGRLTQISSGHAGGRLAAGSEAWPPQEQEKDEQE